MVGVAWVGEGSPLSTESRIVTHDRCGVAAKLLPPLAALGESGDGGDEERREEGRVGGEGKWRKGED